MLIFGFRFILLFTCIALLVCRAMCLRTAIKPVTLCGGRIRLKVMLQLRWFADELAVDACRVISDDRLWERFQWTNRINRKKTEFKIWVAKQVKPLCTPPIMFVTDKWRYTFTTCSTASTSKLQLAENANWFTQFIHINTINSHNVSVNDAISLSTCITTKWMWWNVVCCLIRCLLQVTIISFNFIAFNREYS